MLEASLSDKISRAVLLKFLEHLGLLSLLVKPLLPVMHWVCDYNWWMCDRLIHDRELALFDGRRLLRQDRYDEIKKLNNFSDDVMKEKYVL